MAYPSNILQQVQLYNKSNLALLQNLCPFLNLSNKKFKNFQDTVGNLGSSTTFDLPPRAISSTGLNVTWEAAVQRVATLVCDQAENASYTITDIQKVFNFNDENYVREFGLSFLAELAASIEGNLALNSISAVPVNSFVNNQTIPTGALHTESGPYRFYGDGVTAINSYTQLATMISQFKAYGSASNQIRVILPNTIVPQVIGTGLAQFAPRRNDEIAMSWELGAFGGVEYYESNLLPVHTAGNVGQEAVAANRVLTVVSTNDPTGANITQITFSGATAGDAGAIKAGDLLEFQFGISGQPDLYYLTFIGHKPSQVPVQIRATADAAADGSGNVTVDIYPALQSTRGQNQNLQYNLAAGMKAAVMPSHRAGIVIGGNAFFVSMPRLPDTDPFVSSTITDQTTGASCRTYYGEVFGQAIKGLVTDATWGSLIVPEYTMRICFPVDQTV